MAALTRKFLGEPVPKQFCTFLGTRSMLQHTLDRAAAIVPPEQVVTVIGPGQRRRLDGALDCEPSGPVVEQPFDRGTAPAIYLALTQILERDPLATVLILPANHFIFPEDRFVTHAINACSLAQRHPSDLVLIGTNAEQRQNDCGWIQPDKREWARFWCNPGSIAMEVLAFREKPSEAEMSLLFRWGWLVNTMIMAVRGQTLWDLGWELLPQVMRKLETLHTVVHAIERRQIDRSHAGIALGHLFRSMEPRDFASSVLQQAAHRTRVLPMTDVFWSAWDEPRNITAALRRVGMQNLLPAEMQLPDVPQPERAELPFEGSQLRGHVA